MAAQDVRHVGAFPGPRTADHHPGVFQEHGHELFHRERAMAIEGIRAGVGIEDHIIRLVAHEYRPEGLLSGATCTAAIRC